MEKASCPDSAKQNPQSDPLWLSKPQNPQNIPAAFGKTIDSSFDTLLPVEVGLIAKGVEIPVNPLHIIQRHIGADIAFCSMKNLALSRCEAGKPAPHGNTAGKFYVVSP